MCETMCVFCERIQDLSFGLIWKFKCTLKALYYDTNPKMGFRWGHVYKTIFSISLKLGMETKYKLY